MLNLGYCRLTLTETIMCFFVFLSDREGRSNAHIKGDYQRVGDILLKNIQGLKVTP